MSTPSDTPESTGPVTTAMITEVIAREMGRHKIEGPHRAARMADHLNGLLRDALGLDWEDVEALRRILHEHDDVELHPLPDDDLARLRGIANKLAALLPPKEETP